MLLRDFARPIVVANVVAWPLAWLAARLKPARVLRFE
jgi:hypothetical protein